MSNKQKLELTWIGKENRPRLEPRVLVEEPDKSYHAPFRVSENDQFDNLLIHGDNLLALKALEQEYTGQVKCVYIDPPYNTGSAFEHYEDGLEHSIWLSLFRDRVEILHKLLMPEGVLFCSIDNSELFYAGLVMDEVFGRSNRIEILTWKKSYGGGAKSKYVVNQHEHILVYARDLERTPLFYLPPDPDAVDKYYKYKDSKYTERGPYRLQPLATNSMDERPNLKFPIYLEDGTEIWPEKQWQWSKDRVEKAQANDELVFTNKKGKTTVSYKQYLKDPEGEERCRKPKSIIEGAYTQHGTNESVGLFGQENKFSFPKPEALIHELIEFSTNSGDLVLDSFLGSGTTAAVSHKMGRRWIGIELGDHCETHCLPRLKKVVDGEDSGGITKAVDWKGGGGFRYYRLAPSLIKEDQWGNPVINPDFQPELLSEAVCKLEGFTYKPSAEHYWMHGQASETDFIYVTTQTLSRPKLEEISAAVGPGRSLLVCCSAFRVKPDAFENLTLKKIPKAVLHRCEWNRDDYSLEIKNLPEKPPEPGQQEMELEQ